MSQTETRPIVLLFGPPGAGKGSCSALFKTEELPIISTGDELREEKKNKTDLGKQAQEFQETGKLVPDDLMIKILKNTLEEKYKDAVKKGFVLDGFPRTKKQAEALDEYLKTNNEKVTKVFALINTDESKEAEFTEELTKRVEGRWSSETGKDYNIYNGEIPQCLAQERHDAGLLDRVEQMSLTEQEKTDLKSKEEQKPAKGDEEAKIILTKSDDAKKEVKMVDGEGNPLFKRSDDNRDVMPKRLKEYKTQTESVLAHYQNLVYTDIAYEGTFYSSNPKTQIARINAFDTKKNTIAAVKKNMIGMNKLDKNVTYHKTPIGIASIASITVFALVGGLAFYLYKRSASSTAVEGNDEEFDEEIGE